MASCRCRPELSTIWYPVDNALFLQAQDPWEVCADPLGWSVDHVRWLFHLPEDGLINSVTGIWQNLAFVKSDKIVVVCVLVWKCVILNKESEIEVEASEGDKSSDLGQEASHNEATSVEVSDWDLIYLKISYFSEDEVSQEVSWNELVDCPTSVVRVVTLATVILVDNFRKLFVGNHFFNLP